MGMVTVTVGGYTLCWTEFTSTAQVGRREVLAITHEFFLYISVFKVFLVIIVFLSLTCSLRVSHCLPVGYSDLGVSETPFLYSLLVTRCREDYCEDFCVYKGSSPEHSAFLPPGFSSARHRIAVSITVEDHQGAANIALNK